MTSTFEYNKTQEIREYAAMEWLESAENVFDVIQTVKDYEIDNYGEVFTYMEEPERLVNMYVFILGEQVIVEVIDEHMSRIEVR